MIKDFFKQGKYILRDVFINFPNRKKLKNSDFTIIANDCTAGWIYHDLKQKFNSPTINLFMSASDYIKFIFNMRYYLSLNMQEVKQNKFPYPCATLGDITLHLVHYDSFEQARLKWDERKKRINWDNLFFIMNDRNGCTQKEFDAFCNVPYKNKVFFTYELKDNINGVNICRVEKSENGMYVRIVSSYNHLFSLKRGYDKFDFIKWLNNQ